MRVAYHFDEVSVPTVDHLFPLQAERILVLRALIQQIPRHRRHVRMRSGLPGSAWSDLSKDVRSRGNRTCGSHWTAGHRSRPSVSFLTPCTPRWSRSFWLKASLETMLLRSTSHFVKWMAIWARCRCG